MSPLRNVNIATNSRIKDEFADYKIQVINKNKKLTLIKINRKHCFRSSLNNHI